MDLKLHFLDSFHARGSDGATYKVMVYERMRHDDTLIDTQEQHWVPTGVQEYRLDSGELVEAGPEGQLFVARTGVTLQRP
jgi:hypothetical protein